MVTGERPVTVHHVRFCGSPKNDRRTLPLAARLHMLTHCLPGTVCIEHGKKRFEETYDVDIEAEILKLNREYEAWRIRNE
jgi:hypothetical protein